jgi:farnesyl diphosphate synthase
VSASVALNKKSRGFDLGQWMAVQLAAVESALERWVAPPDTAPVTLAEPMRYAVLDGGK